MKELIVLERPYAVLLVLFMFVLFTTVGWLSSSFTPMVLRLLERKKKEKEMPLKKRIETLESQVRLQSEKILELQNTLNTVFLSHKRR